jgi:hypothetical protein
MYQRYQNRETGTGFRGAMARIIRQTLPPMQGVRTKLEDAMGPTPEALGGAPLTAAAVRESFRKTPMRR